MTIGRLTLESIVLECLTKNVKSGNVEEKGKRKKKNKNKNKNKNI